MATSAIELNNTRGLGLGATLRHLSLAAFQQPCPRCGSHESDPIQLSDDNDDHDDENIATLRCCRDCGDVRGYDDTTAIYDDCLEQSSTVVLSSAGGKGDHGSATGAWKMYDRERRGGASDHVADFDDEWWRRGDGEAAGYQRGGSLEPEVCSGLRCDDGMDTTTGHECSRPVLSSSCAMSCDVCSQPNPDVMIFTRNTDGWVVSATCPKCDRTVYRVDEFHAGNGSEASGDENTPHYGRDHPRSNSLDTSAGRPGRSGCSGRHQRQEPEQRMAKHLVTDLSGAFVESGKRMLSGIVNTGNNGMIQTITDGTLRGRPSKISTSMAHLATAEIIPLSAALGQAAGSAIALGLSAAGATLSGTSDGADIGIRMGAAIGHEITDLLTSSQRRR